MADKDKQLVSPLKPLLAEQLRSTCRPELLGFNTTRVLYPIDDLVGQERALGALHFGTRIEKSGYNMFVLGPQGTGRHTAVSRFLEKNAATEVAADDWVYVSNFGDEHKPTSIRLPPGVATTFKDAMHELVEDLRRSIPAIFQSDDYREKRRAIDTEFEEQHEKALESLRLKAQSKNIGIMQTPMGFALAPMLNDEILKPDEFKELPESQRKSIEANIADLQKLLASVLENVPTLQKLHRERIRQLHAGLMGEAVDVSIQDISKQFQDIDAIQKRLIEVRNDLVDNVDLFLDPQPPGQQQLLAGNGLTLDADRRFNRYAVNVMVANDSDGDKKGLPVIFEEHPTLANLVGRIEHQAQMGALVTDFTMIRAGALHKANGGYLVLDAAKVLTEMLSWQGLKRALKSESINIVSVAEELSLVSTITLKPEPIPLNLKVVMIGEQLLYYLLYEYDPEFADLFKVQVDFDDVMVRTEDNINLHARLIASIAEREELRVFDAQAVGRVIDEVSRYADDAERLTLNVRQLADLLRESDFWAAEVEDEVIAIAHVEKAVKEKTARESRIRERSLEYIDRNILLIETSGSQVGQINGLSVSQLGKFSFGRPTRITVLVRMGSGKVIDIERESRLGGPLHSKGVLILSGYLCANYALDMPTSLWASIVFEQSYGGVDGDSASSAELYALLSALSGMPINQSLAVTGSVNQMGEVQAIGGVNEKIEGFFDVCSTRGLTGEQGVLIPESNIKHLMLRTDIQAAAEKNQFHIYPVTRFEQGIELLTGCPAGVKQEDGSYPEGTINRLVEDKLRQFAQARQSFTDSKADGEPEEGELPE